MPGPSLGTNMHGLVDWSTAFPFVDLFRLSRGWFTQTDAVFDTGQTGLLDLDAQGWVRGFTTDDGPAPFDRVATILFTGGHLPAGTYILDWQGAGDLNLSLLRDDQILQRDDHRIVLQLDAGQMLGLSLSSTDPHGTGDYIRDIRLYNQQDADLIAAGRQFTPEFLEKIEGFRVLRFMDWMETNNSAVTAWEETRPGDAARETGPGGASVETMVALANETRTDPWFTLPHQADDDYIRRFATYIRDHLDPGLVARFELSNEVWNWGFDQSHFAVAAANNLWGEVEGGWMQWYGMRAAEMAGIVADVFGNETGSRALNVFATQSGWHGLENYALDAPALVAAGGTAPRAAPFHVYAIAPYFGGSMGSAEMSAQVDGWIAAGEAGFLQALDWLRHGDAGDTLAHIGDTIGYHAAVAQRLGWQLEAYEGGQHIVDLDGLFGGDQDQAHTDFFTALVRRPEFAALYRDYFDLWADAGGGLFAHFADFGEGSRYGSWGIWDSIYSPDTPRAEAVIAYRDTVAVWWDDDRDAATFANGIIRVDRDADDVMRGTARGDMLVGLGGDNRLTGGRGDDLLTALGGDDRISGGRGNDGLIGRGGADLLIGGRGRDVLSGGAGADVLIGGAGRDLLDGGAGADVFVFGRGDSPATNPDTILDLNASHDRIDVAGFDAGDPVVWLGLRHFSGAGIAEARFDTASGGGRPVLQIDSDGDGQADLGLILEQISGQGVLSDLIV